MNYQQSMDFAIDRKHGGTLTTDAFVLRTILVRLVLIMIVHLICLKFTILIQAMIQNN